MNNYVEKYGEIKVWRNKSKDKSPIPTYHFMFGLYSQIKTGNKILKT